jgi:hypothetical protein
MAKDEKPSEDLSAMAEKTVEQARGAMENYVDFFQKTMSALPWANTELNKKVADYAQKLMQSMNPQDAVRIQTEFFQTQMKSLTEQAKDLSETATKTIAGALKGPFS